MRYIKIYLFIFIFFIPKDVNSSEIQETIFASWNKSDVNLFYTLPDVINEETKVLFIIHGGSRNAYDYLKIWIELSKNKNIILVAPEFSRNNHNDYALLNMSDHYANPNKNNEEYLDMSISSFFNFFKSKYGLKVNDYKIYGHSGGAQFLHRYILFSNDSRISSSVIANSGYYTFLNWDDYPYGIKDVDELNSKKIENFLSEKVTMLIGEKDRGFTRSSHTSANEKGIIAQGSNRFQRANNYFNHLVVISEQFEIPFRWKFYVVENVGHENKKMSSRAAEILLNDVSDIET